MTHTPLSAVGGIAGAADTDLFCAEGAGLRQQASKLFPHCSLPAACTQPAQPQRRALAGALRRRADAQPSQTRPNPPNPPGAAALAAGRAGGARTRPLSLRAAFICAASAKRLARVSVARFCHISSRSASFWSWIESSPARSKTRRTALWEVGAGGRVGDAGAAGAGRR